MRQETDRRIAAHSKSSYDDRDRGYGREQSYGDSSDNYRGNYRTSQREQKRAPRQMYEYDSAERKGNYVKIVN